MTEKEQAEYLYRMVRAQIKDGHDPRLLHSTTKSAVGVMINSLIRGSEDGKYWYGVKMELGKIEE